MDDDRLRSWIDRWHVRADLDTAMSRIATRRARRRMARRLQVVALTMIVLVGTAGLTYALVRIFGAGSSRRPAGLEQRNGLVAFVRIPPGTTAGDIYVARADGSHPRMLTGGPGANADPEWSPDGRTMAFAHAPSLAVPFQIYVMNADGSGVTRLTDEPGGAGQPRWSPDGQRIVFISYRDESRPRSCRPCNVNLYAINVDGGGLSRVTDMPGIERNPSWTADGRVVFVNTRERGGIQVPPPDGQHTYVVNADGTGLNRMFECRFGNLCPDGLLPLVSPDGRRMAFIGPRKIVQEGNPAEEWGFYETDAGGAHLRFVRVCEANDMRCHVFDAAWSADGRKLVFTGETRSHALALFTMNVDGTGLKELPLSNASNPSWQPLPVGT